MAGGRIQGITIEIGGDTTKLTDSLKKVDKNLSKTQSALRDVNKLLKLDPGNTELLRQKQQGLEKQIGLTRDRLKELKAAAQQASENIKTEEDREKFNALQREIVDTEQKLKRLENEYKSFGSVAAQQIAAAGGKMQDFGEKIQNVGGKIEDVGKRLSVLSGGIAAIGGAAVKAYGDVREGTETIIRKTGAAGDQLEEMRGIMESIAETIPTDYGVAGEAIGELSTRFNVNGEQLEALSRQYIQFCDLNETDVTNAVDQSQKALSAYGLGAESAAAFLDRMNRTSQNTGVQVTKLMSGIVSNATAFQELGLDIDQATVFMGQLEKSGANSETVLNGMRKALKNATKDGKNLSQALTDLQDEILTGTDGMDGLTLAYDVFGKSGDQIYGAVKNGTIDFRNLAAGIEDAGGSVAETFENTLDPMDRVKTTMNRVKNTGAELGGTLLQYLPPVLDRINALTKKASDGWNKLSDKQKDAIIKTAGVVAAVGPALVVIGKLTTGVGKVITVGGKLLSLAPKAIGMITAIKAGMLAVNPVILAGAAAVGVIAAAIGVAIKTEKDYIARTYDLTEAQKKENAELQESADAYRAAQEERKKTCDGIRNEYGYYEQLWQELQTLVDENGKVKAGYEARAEVITGKLENALDVELEMVDGVVTGYRDLKTSIRDVIETKKAEALLAANEEAYVNAIREKKDAQVEYYQKLQESAEAEKRLQTAQAKYDSARMQSDPNNPLGSLGNIAHYSTELKAAKAAAQEASTAVENAATVYFGAMTVIANTDALEAAIAGGEGLDTAMRNLSEGFLTAETASKQMLEAQLADFESQYAILKNAVETGMDGVLDADLAAMQQLVLDARAELGKFGDAGAQAITNAEGPVADAAGDVGSKAGSAVAEGVQGKTGEAQTAGEAVGTAAKQGAESVSLVASGQNMALGIAQGLLANSGAVQSAANRLANIARQTINNAMQIESPSKVTREQGAYTGEGFALGILDTVKKVKKAAGALTDAVDMRSGAVLLGGSDRQAAALYETQKQTAAATMGFNAMTRSLEKIYNRLDRMEMRLDSGALVGAMTPGIDRSLGNTAVQKARGI